MMDGIGKRFEGIFISHGLTKQCDFDRHSLDAPFQFKF